jgi:hypothetical protein
VDEFSSLGLVKDFKFLARVAKMTVVLSRIQLLPQLNPSAGWMIKQVLNQSIS